MVTANVARSEEEAEIQEKTGEAVISTEGEGTLVDEDTSVENALEGGSDEDDELEINSDETDEADPDHASEEGAEED